MFTAIIGGLKALGGAMGKAGAGIAGARRAVQQLNPRSMFLDKLTAGRKKKDEEDEEEKKRKQKARLAAMAE